MDVLDPVSSSQRPLDLSPDDLIMQCETFSRDQRASLDSKERGNKTFLVTISPLPGTLNTNNWLCGAAYDERINEVDGFARAETVVRCSRNVAPFTSLCRDISLASVLIQVAARIPM
jgi:hypothetical protein